MRPEHRDAIEEKFRKKVEALVRRPSDEELEEERCACPFCAAALPATAQACDTCKSALPMCVLTGRFVLAEDAGACPTCRFPASLAALQALARAPDPACPMCGAAVDARALQPPADAAAAVAALRLAADGEAADEEADEREANAAAAAATAK
jgi:WD repeat-containing protein 19